MYSGPMCAFCDAAKRLLKRNNLEYKVIDVSTGPELRDEMIQKANGRRTIPQIFFNDEHRSSTIFSNLYSTSYFTVYLDCLIKSNVTINCTIFTN